MKEKTEFKEHEHQRIEEEKKNKAMVIENNDSHDEGHGIDVLRMAMQQEELGEAYDP